MSAPVDVLAVMLAAEARWWLVYEIDKAEAMSKARAAVAELIEAAQDLRATIPPYSVAYGFAERRLDAALVRVGGAK